MEGTIISTTERATEKPTNVLTPSKVNDGGPCSGNSQRRASFLLKVANALSVESGVFPYPVTDVINKNISGSFVYGEDGRAVRALRDPVGGAIETRVNSTGGSRLVGPAPEAFLQPVAARALPPLSSSPTQRRTDTSTRTEDSTTRLERTPRGDFFFFSRLLFSSLVSGPSTPFSVSMSADEECRQRSNRSFARARGPATLAPLYHIRHQHYTCALISSVGNSASSRTLLLTTPLLFFILPFSSPLRLSASPHAAFDGTRYGYLISLCCSQGVLLVRTASSFLLRTSVSSYLTRRIVPALGILCIAVTAFCSTNRIIK